MKRLTAFSIRIQLILLVLITLVPPSVIIIMKDVEQQKASLRDAEKESTRLVQQLSAQQERTAENARRLLLMLSRLSDVRNRDLRACDTLFASLINMDDQYVSLILVDSSGAIIASSSKNKTLNVADRKYFQDAIRTQTFSVGEFAISRLSNKPALHFAYPILDEGGEVTMVLAVGLNLDYFSAVYARAQLPEKTQLVLSDWRGIILYSEPNTQLTGTREEDSLLAVMRRDPRMSGAFGADDRGTGYINAYHRVYLEESGELYMFVRAGISKDVMLSGARWSMWINIAVFAIVYIIALTIAWLFADRSIIRKIELVVNAAQNIARGSLDTETGIPHSHGELGALSRSFEDMSGALRKRALDREQVQQMLQEVGDRYRMLFDHIPQPLIVVDAKSHGILDVNRAAVANYGYTHDEFLQLKYHELVSEQPSLRMLMAARHGTLSRETESGMRKHVKKDGEQIDVDISCVSITYRGLGAQMMSVTDVTERVRGEKVQQALYKIYRASNMAGTLQELYGMIHRILGEIIPAQNFSIALHDTAQDTISYPYFVDEYAVTPLPQKSGRGLAAYVLRTGEPLLAVQETVQALAARGDVESAAFAGIEWLGAPLKVDDRSIGLVALRSYDDAVRFKEKDKIFLLFISSQIAKAIDRKRADDALRESELQLRRSQSSLSEAQALATLGSWHKDLITGATTWSETMFDIFGLSPKSPVPNHEEFYRIVHPEDVAGVKEATNRTKEGAITHLDYRILRHGSDVRHVTSKMKPTFDRRHCVVEILGTILDITDRKEAEEKVRRSLREKDVLLKEIHHRVKNNMQIISSLLNLQAASTADPSAREILSESRQRVRSMALIHETLYQSDNFSDIDLDEYIRRIVIPLFHSYKRDDIGCSISVQPMKLTMDAAVPCGLIVNELVSNALKYAFPSGAAGTVSVSIAVDDGHTVLLDVCDDGIGMPSTVRPESVQTLGLQLVNSLVHQLEGSMQIDSHKGTHVHVAFRH